MATYVRGSTGALSSKAPTPASLTLLVPEAYPLVDEILATFIYVEQQIYGGEDLYADQNVMPTTAPHSKEYHSLYDKIPDRD